MNNTFGVVINRLSIGFLFAVVYQIFVASATYLLSIPLSGNISDLFLGIKKADSEGFLLISWWIISTVIITLISLFIVKHKHYFSVYKNEKDIDIPPKISFLTIIVIGSIISFMFFLMDSAIGIFVPSNSTADVQAIYESALDGNFIPFYFSVLFSLLTGFIIVGVAAKTSKVSKITSEFGVNNFSYLSKFLTKKKSNRITMTDTIGFRPGALIHIGEKKVENIQIDLIEYDEKNVTEIKNATIEACLESKNKLNVTWINIIGIHDPKVIEKFGNAFGVHSLHQSNIMNTELRPSIDIYENYIFLMLKMQTNFAPKDKP